MTQFTASEVRELAATIWPDLSGREEVAETLNAFADLLAAQEKAVPVMVVNHVSSAEHDLPIGMKLYAHPGPSDAERLAEALRVFDGSFLKELADLVSFPEDDRGCINRSFVMERVVGLRRCWDKLSATRAHSAQAPPPAASVTDAKMKVTQEMVSALHGLKRILRGAIIQGDARVLGITELAEAKARVAALEAALAAQENPHA